MSIIYSGTTIATVKYGSTTLDKVYYGSTLVYQRDTNTYIFNNGTLGSGVTLQYGSIIGSYIKVDSGTSVSDPRFYFSSALPASTLFYIYYQNPVKYTSNEFRAKFSNPQYVGSEWTYITSAIGAVGYYTKSFDAPYDYEYSTVGYLDFYVHNSSSSSYDSYVYIYKIWY